MPLQKQPVSINFTQGVDTKTDPYQVGIGKFLTLTNSVFTTQGRLTKRNGYGMLTTLANTNQTTLTTLNDNLLATGSSLYAFSADTNQWINKGTIQPVNLDVLALVRNSSNQSAQDSAVASNGLVCVAYNSSDGATYYQILDNRTGQQIVAQTSLAATGTSPRVFVLGRYFVITYIATIAGVRHLQYLAIPTAVPTSPLAAADISTTLTSTSAGYDGYVSNNALYVAWADTGTVVKVSYISSSLVLQSAQTIASHTATQMSVTADETGSTPVIWVTFWDSGSNNGYSAAFSSSLAAILAPTLVISSIVINALTTAAKNSIASIFYEHANNYNTTGAYPVSNIKTDYIDALTCTRLGVVSATTTILRSVGLGSKAFIGTDDNIYMLATYGEANQPTYFLISSTGAIIMRLAYSNGGGYITTQVLPSVSSVDDVYYVAYLIKDFLASTNKITNLTTGTPTSAIYTQTGINLAAFEINMSGQYSSEIAASLHLTGGQVWQYDGVKPVEEGFQVWPENVQVVGSSSGGSMTAQKYFYVFTYEWTDNQGMLQRSAPSIPFTVTTTGTTSKATCYVPTLRLTYKVTPNPVRIVGYRWSVAQQTYYQFTSITSPTLNDPSVDYVTIQDTNADISILGQTLLYTTGGVLENIAPPAAKDIALYKNRVFLIDAEDPNLLWYSKQVIQSVPVEFSDLLTLYVAPTTGAQGSTGPMKAISAMDDKFIIFKSDAIYYITGTGPDNTGANNDFSDAVFITSSVGCDNPNSIVLIPDGLMFQSGKGIWLLGRDLGTKYIGSAVEAFNDQVVISAENIPGTNQVRFTLDNNSTLMFDYFYGQWGEFTNVRAISAVLYNGLHTYLNEDGQVLQETPGAYLDGTQPVLMSFTTSWINIAGLQGFERFYELNILGTYHTPFKLNIELAYDYNFSSTQATQVTPQGWTGNWGDEPSWGTGAPWGGAEDGNVFDVRLFPRQQKCESFIVKVSELYDSSFGVPAGEGLSLSGLNLVIGIKKGNRTQKASKSFG